MKYRKESIMKISIVVSNSLKKDPRVIKQIKIAKQNGYEVQFVGYSDRFTDKQFLNEIGVRYDLVELGDDYIGKLRSPIKKIKRLFLRPQMAIDYICDFNPDIIHANDFDTLGLARGASKKCNAKLIYDSHEVFAENIGIANKKFLKNYIILREKFLVKKIDAMISVSNSAAEYFKEKYRIKRPTVITNCPLKNTIPLKEKIKDSFEVVYQGLMVEGRGYEEFVMAAKNIDDGIRFVLRGYGSIEGKLKNLIKENKLEQKIVFDEPVEVAQLVSAASSSHVGIVLTKPVNLNFKLSISNKVFEYAAAGLPVILSDVPEHRYLNDKYNFGVIIDEVTPENIAKAVNQLYADKERYDLLALNAKKMAEEMVWGNEAKKLISIYEGLNKGGECIEEK